LNIGMSRSSIRRKVSIKHMNIHLFSPFLRLAIVEICSFNF
jgi:hypothetical protein